MTEPKLKPCPFCGGEARIIPYSFEDYVVKCKECGCVVGIYDTEEEAIEHWNKRVWNNEECCCELVNKRFGE